MLYIGILHKNLAVLRKITHLQSSHYWRHHTLILLVLLERYWWHWIFLQNCLMKWPLSLSQCLEQRKLGRPRYSRCPLKYLHQFSPELSVYCLRNMPRKSRSKQSNIANWKKKSKPETANCYLPNVDTANCQITEGLHTNSEFLELN